MCKNPDKEKVHMSEDAAMPYNPVDDVQAPIGEIQEALGKAERKLYQQRGVKGIGITKTAGGQDAILVYVENEQILSRLPTAINAFPVIGEVTGEIRPQ